jgi:hypothetical protein
MEALLVKIFTTALALSQVMTTPSAVRTEFDRQYEQPQEDGMPQTTRGAGRRTAHG